MKTFDLLLLLNQQWVRLITSKCSLFGIFEVRGGIKASQSSIFNIKICVCLILSLTATSSSLNRSVRCLLSTSITSLSYLSENHLTEPLYMTRRHFISRQEYSALKSHLNTNNAMWERDRKFGWSHCQNKVVVFIREKLKAYADARRK